MSLTTTKNNIGLTSILSTRKKNIIMNTVLLFSKKEIHGILAFNSNIDYEWNVVRVIRRQYFRLSLALCLLSLQYNLIVLPLFLILVAILPVICRIVSFWHLFFGKPNCKRKKNAQ